MKSILLVFALGALSCSACSQEQQPDVAESSTEKVAITGENSDFLVKLTSDVSAEANSPGDPVTGVIIDPRPFRGGRVEGTISRADRSFLDFSFHTVRFDGETYPIVSKVTAVVNSAGNAGHDDLGQRIRMVGGGVIAYGTTTAINEGAEIYLVGWQE